MAFYNFNEKKTRTEINHPFPFIVALLQYAAVAYFRQCNFSWGSSSNLCLFFLTLGIFSTGFVARYKKIL